MPHESDPDLLVLHTLRLKGVAESVGIAATFGLPEEVVDRRLQSLAAAGLVVRRSGLLNGWMLTAAGRQDHEARLANELDDAGARPTVEAGYRRFRRLNPAVLHACSRWQVREVAGRMVPNDHADAGHDADVVDDLETALVSLRPVGEDLATVLERYRPYGPRLDDAMARVRLGDGDYVTKPMIPSIHTVWFELHEDLLATLGRDRSVEADGSAWEGTH